jgi:hypothetical protein
MLKMMLMTVVMMIDDNNDYLSDIWIPVICLHTSKIASITQNFHIQRPQT